MNRLKSLIYISILGGIFAIIPGCYDENLWYADGNGDGMAIVNLEANFSPFAGNKLTRGSNVAPADGFNDISDMAILVFNSDESQTLYKIFEPKDYEVDPDGEERSDIDASNGHSAESKTLSVKNISLSLPFGYYYIVAVANFGNYSVDESNNVTSFQKLEQIITDAGKDESDKYKFTLKDLLGIKVNWDTENYKNNRAMLGYFSNESKVPHSESSFETVKVDGINNNLQAWMRRCVSKITVDFDGSALSDNVSIYIKDVRIYDLAKECSLGFGYANGNEDETDFNNHPQEGDLIKFDGKKEGDQIIGTHIDFGEGEEYKNWTCITNKENKIYIFDERGSKMNLDNLHGEESPCLYFYENMQNINLQEPRPNRTPVPDLYNGGVAGGYNAKDGVSYGTYIEVTAHHVAEINGDSEETDITYRFMLGKNVTNDFDAERNYHYKLTLQFLGKANEYHWQIDYKYIEGFKVPNPWYVSYVYNHDAYLPFEFNLPEADDEGTWELTDMKAEIETNPWYPTTSSNYVEGDDPDLRKPDYEITPTTPVGDDNGDFTNPYDGYPNNHATGNGFLSLRAPIDESTLTSAAVGKEFTGYNSDTENINQDYFEGKTAGSNYRLVNHGERQIVHNGVACNEPTDPEREKIYLQKKNNIYSISIPLFTREKSLVKQTAYTGNNPFVGYQRVAKVILTATAVKKDKNGNIIMTKDDYSEQVNVVQVRRLVNPKGVYRSSTNSNSFDVDLKFLTSEDNTGSFVSIKSRGPWMAEIVGDKSFFTLDGKQRVSGSSGNNIKFKILFNRSPVSGNKNAIIRIKYHNYTCTHLIFVRKGYDAQELSSTGTILDNTSTPNVTKWNTFNLIAGNKMATDPRDEGSLFRYGNPYDAISSSCNIYTDNILTDESNNKFVDPNGALIFHEVRSNQFVPHKELTILDSKGEVNPDKNKWTQIDYKAEGSTDYLKGFTVAKDMKISQAATIRDFEQLYLTKYIEFGYGVLYADGAEKTQESLEMANGWFRDDTSPNKDQKGMRGVFAYYYNPTNPNDPYNGRNLFFPIGRSGYGHRKDTEKYGWGENAKEINKDSGILRYSCNRPYSASACGTTSFVQVAPLFEFLYRRMGAIYWARCPKNKFLPANGDLINGRAPYEDLNDRYWDNIPCALDFNYFTFDVDAINENNLNIFADACFVRTVEETSDQNPDDFDK